MFIVIAPDNGDNKLGKTEEFMLKSQDLGNEKRNDQLI